MDHEFVPYVEELLTILGDEVMEVTGQPHEHSGAVHTTLGFTDGRQVEVFQFMFINQFLTPVYLVRVLEGVLSIIDDMKDRMHTVALVFPSGSEESIQSLLQANMEDFKTVLEGVDCEIWFMDYANAIIETFPVGRFMKSSGVDEVNSRWNEFEKLRSESFPSKEDEIYPTR